MKGYSSNFECHIFLLVILQVITFKYRFLSRLQGKDVLRVKRDPRWCLCFRGGADWLHDKHGRSILTWYDKSHPRDALQKWTKSESNPL